MAADREEELLEALDHAALEHTPTCVLDMVEGGASHTLEAVGNLLGVTRERMRQIETIAIGKIRDEHGDDEELATWEEARSDARARPEWGD